MPITNLDNPRNFITKITTYEHICSIKNSMTVLPELLPLILDMMIKNTKGTINLTNPGDIVSSFDWEIILNNRKNFKSKYGILIDKENQLFESKAMSNLDEKLMFMVEKEIFYSRNFDLPLERCVVWTVNDKGEINSVLNMNVYGVVTDISDKL